MWYRRHLGRRLGAETVASILIIGASSGIGLQTVNLALKSGHNVRALSRSADRIALDNPYLEKRKGDALKQSDVSAALSGIDVVIQTLGVSPGPKMVLGPVRLFSNSTRLLVEAMESAKVGRLISVTGFGAGDSRTNIGCLERIPFELVLGRAYFDKDVQERLIRRSSLDWTVVRPVLLTSGPATGRYETLLDPAQWRNGFISRADVADFLVRQIADARYIGEAPVLRSRLRTVLDACGHRQREASLDGRNRRAS